MIERVSPRKAAQVRPQTAPYCVVAVSADASLVRQISRHLTELGHGRLLAYRRVEDLLRNPPVGRVALAVLPATPSPAAARAALRWMRRVWPRCHTLVLGEQGGGAQERLAREGGATFLTSPVPPGIWSDLVTHALHLATTSGATKG